jgi:hypothetical protein
LLFVSFIWKFGDALTQKVVSDLEALGHRITHLGEILKASAQLHQRVEHLSGSQLSIIEQIVCSYRYLPPSRMLFLLSTPSSSPEPDFFLFCYFFLGLGK